jgi:enterochelin esterase-like enzyme
MHDYEEYEGGHEWAYWQEHVIDSMLFFSRFFK